MGTRSLATCINKLQYSIGEEKGLILYSKRRIHERNMGNPSFKTFFGDSREDILKQIREYIGFHDRKVVKILTLKEAIEYSDKPRNNKFTWKRIEKYWNEKKIRYNHYVKCPLCRKRTKVLWREKYCRTCFFRLCKTKREDFING